MKHFLALAVTSVAVPFLTKETILEVSANGMWRVLHRDVTNSPSSRT